MNGKCVGLVLLVLLLGCRADAQPAKFPWNDVIPNNLGTQYGGGFDKEDARAIAQDLGAKWLRIECGWQSVERKKGEYTFDSFDTMLDMILEQGIEPIIIFDYGHPLYFGPGDDKADPFIGPVSTEAQQGYANFCAAVAGHLNERFPDRVFVYELWNEPNFDMFWHPKPEAVIYTRLAKVSYPAIKKAAPKCIVMGPATSSASDPFLGQCIDEGILDAIDAFSIHPYRRRPPESAIEDYAKLRKLIADRNEKDSKPDRVMPLVNSEWGYSAAKFEKPGIWCGPELQGPYLARMWLISAWQEHGVSIWFQWRGGMDDNNEPYSMFGMLKDDRTPRPSYTAAKTLIDTLRGYRCVGRIDVESKDDYVLKFEHAETKSIAIAAWTTGKEHVVRVPWNGDGKLIFINLTGERSAAESKDKQVEVKLSAGPVYVISAGR